MLRLYPGCGLRIALVLACGVSLAAADPPALPPEVSVPVGSKPPDGQSDAAGGAAPGEKAVPTGAKLIPGAIPVLDLMSFIAHFEGLELGLPPDDLTRRIAYLRVLCGVENFTPALARGILEVHGYRLDRVQDTAGRDLLSPCWETIRRLKMRAIWERRKDPPSTPLEPPPAVSAARRQKQQNWRDSGYALLTACQIADLYRGTVLCQLAITIEGLDFPDFPPSIPVKSPSLPEAPLETLLNLAGFAVHRMDPTVSPPVHILIAPSFADSPPDLHGCLVLSLEGLSAEHVVAGLEDPQGKVGAFTWKIHGDGPWGMFRAELEVLERIEAHIAAEKAKAPR